MKKLLVIPIFILILILFLAACGGQSRHNEEHEGYEGYEEYEEYEETVQLTIEQFLEDLDYMVYVLENNFALLDVANWAHGIDYKELAANTRNSVLAMEEPCQDVFLAIVCYHFFPMFSTGHFQIFHHDTFDSMSRGVHYGPYRGQRWLMNLEQMRLENRFYEPQNQERIDIFDATLEKLIEAHGISASRFWSELRPVTTKIIEEGKIAYLSSGRDMTDLRMNEGIIRGFYREIADYEHFIMDLRGNGGGNIDNFIDVLLRPHLREAIDPLSFFFFLDGPYVRRFGEFLFESSIGGGFLTITEPYRPAREILAEYELPEIRHSDIKRLHYGAPAGRPAPIEPTIAMSDFNGKIWMLTDQTMGSAAQMAAYYAKETGRITLVGDRTGGCLGGPRTMAFMPNTGIIFYFDIFYVTDAQGRPLEAGTIPHHFNRQGMDALETVLALIEEGNY